MNQEILNKFSEIESNIRLTLNPYSEGSYLQPEKFFMTDFNYSTLNIIEKIEVNDFEMYCIDAVTEEKIIYPSQDYTLLSVKSKILIVFHNYRKFTAKTYLYAEYDGTKELIQVSLFEDVQRFFHMGKDHSWGSFAFFGSRIVKTADINPNKERCDLNDYGPIFWDNEGNIPEVQSADSQFLEKVDITKFEDFKFVMSVPSKGHIIYLRLKPINGTILSNDYNNNAVIPVVARTLFESIKLIDEWASVNENPWNNKQDISLMAKGFIEGLKIPENIQSEINSLQTDMQVYRYLAGSENARQRPPLEEVALMPQSVYAWFKQQFCYRSFNNLVLYHPLFNE